MIKLEKLSSEAIRIVNNRIADEQTAFYFYISASAWCRLNGYENIARYMTTESAGEEYHFKRLVKYLTDWNVTVDFPAPKEPIKAFKSVEDLLQQQYEMEVSLLRQYEKDTIYFIPVCQVTHIMLQDFVRIQSDAVIEAAGWIRKLNQYKEQGSNMVEFDAVEFSGYSNYY